MIYLDSNATSQIDPRVLEVMLPFLRERFANPSSSYRAAREVRQAIGIAREQVASVLGCEAGEIVFTSCGTESNNAAIESAKMFWPEKKCLVIAATEHSAVIEPAKRWEREGGTVIRVPVLPDGVLDVTALRAMIRPGETALVSVMWANNETGVLAPMSEIAEISHSAGALLHTDAVQAFGKVPLDVRAIPVDYLSLSGHKFHAPKGVGALYVSRAVRFHPSMLGGGQEGGRRSGTENVPYIAGMGEAAALMKSHLGDDTAQRVRSMRDVFEARLLTALPGTLPNGHRELRLPTTSSLCFPGLLAGEMLILLDEAGICCSAGSACHTAAVHPSHVLEAMGLGAGHAASTLRFSFSRFNTMEEVARSADEVIRIARRLRDLRNDAAGPVVLSDEALFDHAS